MIALSRPISWLPRLHEISRLVANSIRSHYDRRDIERLFELQPRAAQKLVELLPSVEVGTARLVEREVLGSFLDRVRDADDVPALIETIRGEKNQVSRRKPRALVRRDHDTIAVGSLPSSVSLRPGLVEVRCQTVVELAEAMVALAKVIESQEFAQTFEVVEPEDKDDAASEVRNLLTRLEKERSQTAGQGDSPC